MRNKITTILFAFFLGGLGIHRFYLGQNKKGLFYLLFSWTFIPMFIGFFDALAFIILPDERFNEKYNNPNPQIQHCSSCGQELTFMTTPNLGGGKLKDGGRVCRNCFGKIVKVDTGFGLNSKKKYSSQDVQTILNTKQVDTNIDFNQVVKVSSQSSGSNSTEISIDLDPEKLIPYIQQQQKQRQAEIKNFNYVHIQIQRQGIQLLESVNIMNSTKNLDTLKSRYEFLTKFYDDFVKASHNSRYISDIQKAIDEYKTMYYDKILKDFEIALLLKPDNETIVKYYLECLRNCFVQFYKEQCSQIETLKRQDAKEKRLEKIIDIADETSSEMTTHCISCEKFDLYNSEIETIRQNTFNDRYKNNS